MSTFTDAEKNTSRNLLIETVQKTIGKILDLMLFQNEITSEEEDYLFIGTNVPVERTFS